MDRVVFEQPGDLGGGDVAQGDRGGLADDEDVVVGNAVIAEEAGELAWFIKAEFKHRGPDRREQPRGGVAGHHLPGVDDRQAVTEPLGFVEVVGGHDDRHSGAFAQGGDDVEEVIANPGVETHGGLVEEKHPGGRQEGPDDLGPASLASAVGGHRPVQDVIDAHGPGQLGQARLSFAWPHAPQPHVQFQVLAAGQRLVDDGILEHNAADGTRTVRVPGDVAPGEQRPARAGDNRRVQHADRGGLACSVRPEQAERLAGRDLEADAPDRLHVAGVGLDQLLRLHGGPGAGRPFHDSSHGSCLLPHR
jgi:hypothetical protein